MVIISVYFDYVKNRASSGPGKAKPISNEEIAEVKWRAHRFESELALGIPDSDTLNFISKCIGDRVAVYRISSSLGIDDLKNTIKETAKGLKLEPPDFNLIKDSTV